MMTVLGFYDGKIVNIDEQVVHLEDRGYQFGDGAYEVTLAYRGKYYALGEHLDRLEKSCRELRIVPSYNRTEVEDICQLLLEEAEMEEAMLYLQWTRGVAPRIHSFPASAKSVLSATIRPRRIHPAEMLENGVKAIIEPDIRWLRCDIKSLNLLGTVLAKQKAFESGCFEAILARDNKTVTEASSSNSFAVKDGIVYTSPADNLILAGITRGIVIRMARDMGIEVREEAVSPEFYRQADEVFLTGTTTEVMPVVQLDAQPVGAGKVGPLARKLQEAYLRSTLSL